MKFINYQMPTGLGITQHYNIYEHNQTTFNGISNITLESENTGKKKELISLQSGGRHYEPNSCEITFYIFDYIIIFEIKRCITLMQSYRVITTLFVIWFTV